MNTVIFTVHHKEDIMKNIFACLRFFDDGISAERKRKASLQAIASAAVAGAGYLLQKNFIKGAAYMAIELAFILLFVFWGGKAIVGFSTLGTTPLYDHSLVLMVYGILAIIALTVFFVFWVSNIVGTYRNGIRITDINYEKPAFWDGVKEWLHDRTALLFLLPGLIAVIAGIFIPLVFSICIGFTDYDAGHQPPAHILNWVGLKNFKDLLVLGQYAKTFFGILGWTFVWTVCSSVLPYALGILLAVILNNPKIRGKKIFKFIYILPWAIPGYISLLVLQSMFDTGYGLINQILSIFGIPGVPWLTKTMPARVALILVSIWTGFSFPMMLSENIIKNISKEIIEAATLDGASGTRIFFSITLPILMFSISPIFIMGMAGAFNNFNTIYLITGGYPLNLNYQSAGSTDILITWLFKLTITNNKYNYGAAISLILFIFIALFSIFNLRKTRAFKEEEMS